MNKAESTFWSILVVSILVLILGGISVGTDHMEKVQKNFTDAGYEQVTLPGAMGYYWQKVR